jgi:hypothetical protein
MILLFIFILGCFVLSIVAVGLLFALASVGYGDVYKEDSSATEAEAQPFPRRVLQPEAVHSRQDK